MTNCHSHATGGHATSLLPIPKCKSEFSKKSFFPSTIKLWNELHGTIRNSVNKLSFKSNMLLKIQDFIQNISKQYSTLNRSDPHSNPSWF